jgi:hypothetical protein
LYDFTKNYTGSFYLGGSMLVASGLILIWPYIKYRLEKRKLPVVEAALGDGLKIGTDIRHGSVVSGLLFGSAYFESHEQVLKDRRCV